MPTAARSPLRSREDSDKHYQNKDLPRLWRLKGRQAFPQPCVSPQVDRRTDG
jgi:hypothetical protein